MEDRSGPVRVVHHHFTISRSGSSASQARPMLSNMARDLLESQDLMLSQSMRSERPYEAVHEHRFHHLSEKVPRDELRLRLQQADPGAQHMFYDAFRSCDVVASSSFALQDLPSVRRALRWALRAELATIPPYIFAAYSVCNQSSQAAKLLKSIAAEEMLHAGLVANLLVALGGVPTFIDQKIQGYPLRLDHMSGLTLHLLPLVFLSAMLCCSKSAGPECLQQFLALERPSSKRLAASAVLRESNGEFESLGELYGAIEAALERLAQSDENLFSNPRPSLQLSSQNYKVIDFNVAESGGLHPICSITDARSALHTIVSQGEGCEEDPHFADSEGMEMTHFKKLQEIAQMAEPVFAVSPNPVAEPGNVLNDLFNCAYSLLLLTLQELYAEADVKNQLNQRMYVVMEKIMRPVGLYMCSKGQGPSFSSVEFPAGITPVEHVKALVKVVLEKFPAIEKLAVALQKL